MCKMKMAAFALRIKCCVLKSCCCFDGSYPSRSTRQFSWAFRAGTPSPLICLPLVCPFFLVPTTSKRLLRTLGSNYKALTGKILVFWTTDKWSLMGGGCLQQVVANGGLTLIYVISLDYFVYIVFVTLFDLPQNTNNDKTRQLHTFGSTLPSDRNVLFTEIFGYFLDSCA